MPKQLIWNRASYAIYFVGGLNVGVNQIVADATATRDYKGNGDLSRRKR